MRCFTIFTYFAQAEVAFVDDFALEEAVDLAEVFFVLDLALVLLEEVVLAVLAFVDLAEQEHPLDLLDFDVVDLVFAISSLLFYFS